MKNRILVAGLALIALTVSCNKTEHNPAAPADGLVALGVTSGIQTRVTGTSWDANDAIGIYVFETGTVTVADGYANVKYVTAAGGAQGVFEPETEAATIYLPISGVTRDVVAFYPYKGVTDGEYQIALMNQSNQSAIDLLWADTEQASRTSPDVAFEFCHMLSKIEVNVAPGAGMTAADLTGLKVQITSQPTLGTFNVMDGTLTPDGLSTGDITMLTETDGTAAEATVLPSDDFTNMALKMTLADGVSVFTWNLTDSQKALKFEAGKKYVYNITLNKVAIEVTSTIVDWAAGNSTGDDGEAW